MLRSAQGYRRHFQATRLQHLQYSKVLLLIKISACMTGLAYGQLYTRTSLKGAKSYRKLITTSPWGVGPY